jgi:hypothetical protein
MSAVVLFCLVQQLVKQKTRADFLKELIICSQKRAKSRRLHLDWPSKFLRKFCAALEIPYDQRANTATEKPIKINMCKFLDMLLAHTIVEITLDRLTNTQKTYVKITLADRDADLKLLQQQIEAAFNQAIEVRLVYEGT